jgi:hypothetical protein
MPEDYEDDGEPLSVSRCGFFLLTATGVNLKAGGKAVFENEDFR